MPDKPHGKRDVEKWVAHTGFAMEMRVARVLSECDFDAFTPSAYYTDPNDPSKVREVDVGMQTSQLASDGESIALCTFYFECKFAGDRPWVAFTSEHVQNEDALRVGVTGHPASAAGAALLESLRDDANARREPLLSLPERIASKVTQPDKKWADTSRDPHDAVEQVTTACRAATTSGGHIRGEKCEVVFPVIVVGGDLYECFLGTHDNPMVVKADRAQIVRISIDTPPQSIYLVTESGLVLWGREAAKSARAIVGMGAAFLDQRHQAR